MKDREAHSRGSAASQGGRPPGQQAGPSSPAGSVPHHSRGYGGQPDWGQGEMPGQPLSEFLPPAPLQLQTFSTEILAMFAFGWDFGTIFGFFKTCLGEAPSTFIHIKDLYFYVLRDMKRGGEAGRGEGCLMLWFNYTTTTQIYVQAAFPP